MTTIDFNKLRAPFHPELVSWRIGSTTRDKQKGLALAYIDARVVQDRLDEVCGPVNWQCRYPHANGKTVCEIGIRVDGEWIWKADGAGDSDVEAEKGAMSDAFKRAAVRFGIGRYLYEIESPWVEIEEWGKTAKGQPAYRMKLDQGTKLRNALKAAAPVPLPVNRLLIAPCAPLSREGFLAECKKTIGEFAAVEAMLKWLSAPEMLANVRKYELTQEDTANIKTWACERKDEIEGGDKKAA